MAHDSVSLSVTFKAQYKAMSHDDKALVRAALRPLQSVMMSIVQYGMDFRRMSILLNVSERRMLRVVVTDNPVRAVVVSTVIE